MEIRSEPEISKRVRWLTVGGLVLATAVAGAVARGIVGSGPSRGGGAGPLLRSDGGGPVSLSGRLDRTAVQVGGDPTVRMELVIAGEERSPSGSVRVPTDLVVVLDRSGSMSGGKLDAAKAAIGELIAQLTPADRFGLVVYSSGAWVVVPLEHASAEARHRWLATVQTVQSNGGTNISGGLDAGQGLLEGGRAASRSPRVILISDGLANEGDSSHEGLVGRGRRAAQGEYTLTTVGVGADFNEYLMRAIADAGTGNYYYVRDTERLDLVFTEEFAAGRTTVATGLEVRIEPRPGVHVVDAGGYPLEYGGDTVTFHPGSLFAGQARSVWVTLRVPNNEAGEDAVGNVSVAYSAGGERATLPLSGTLTVARVQNEVEMLGRVDAGAWARGVVVERYNLMKEEVARAVKAGEQGQALDAIREFRHETEPMNRHVQSAPVQERLDALQALEGEVKARFLGPNQDARQNELSKDWSAAAVDARRPGSKR